MTDTTSSKPQDQSKSKAIPAMIAASLASYIMTQFSLHGVNFETMGVSSEIVKSFLIGNLVAFFTWLSWGNIVSGVADIIQSVHDAFKTWRNAAKS